MREVSRWARLDDHLPRAVRTTLEESLWRPIETQATLEVLMEDPSFFEDPGRHPAMFADHGVVHVRDVASGVVALVDVVDGVLLAARPTGRRHLVQTWGVALAYLHDVGMVDLSPVGRRTHALYAAHVAFSADADPLVDHLLRPGPVREALDAVHESDPFRVPLDTVVREVLSLSAAHSKSTVPAGVLDDRAGLRRLMRRITSTSMEVHRASGRGPTDEERASPVSGQERSHTRPRRTRMPGSTSWTARSGGWPTTSSTPSAPFGPLTSCASAGPPCAPPAASRSSSTLGPDRRSAPFVPPTDGRHTS